MVKKKPRYNTVGTHATDAYLVRIQKHADRLGLNRSQFVRRARNDLMDGLEGNGSVICALGPIEVRWRRNR